MATARRIGMIATAAGVAVGVGAFAIAWLLRPRTERAVTDHVTGQADEGAIRSAGAEAMRTPPAEWSAVDEASDESFPASDPPALNPHRE